MFRSLLKEISNFEIHPLNYVCIIYVLQKIQTNQEMENNQSDGMSGARFELWLREFGSTLIRLCFLMLTQDPKWIMSIIPVAGRLLSEKNMRNEFCCIVDPIERLTLDSKNRFYNWPAPACSIVFSWVLITCIWYWDLGYRGGNIVYCQFNLAS